MKIEFLGSTGRCQNGGGSCPTLYATDRGTFLVQGYMVTDAEALAQLGRVPDGEVVAEVPGDILALARVE